MATARSVAALASRASMTVLLELYCGAISVFGANP